MAELHSNLYIHHDDKDIHTMLSSLFQSTTDSSRPDKEKSEDPLKIVSNSLLPGSAEKLALTFIETVKTSHGDPWIELRAESKETISGYCCYHFIHGYSGEELIPTIVNFIGEIASDADVRAWTVGDDDPWELLCRLQSGQVVSKEYEPEPEERDKENLPDEYVWWHEGLPSEIVEGLINEWKGIDDEEWEEEFSLESEEAPEDLPTIKILKGKVWGSPRTESGLILKVNSYNGYYAVLEDMSQVKRGDTVKVKIVSTDKEKELLICDLIERIPEQEKSR